MVQDEISKDTSEKMVLDFTAIILLTLTGAIERLSANHGKAFEILDSNLDLLGDIRHVYNSANTLQNVSL